MRSLLRSLTSARQQLRIFEPIFRWKGLRSVDGPKEFAEASRILIVRPDDKLGDVILLTAFVREMRRNWPDAEITLLIHPAFRGIFEHCPYVDRIETYLRFRPRFLGQLRRAIEEVRWARDVLWPRRIDLAVIPRSDHRYFREASLAYLSGARWRVSITRGELYPLDGGDDPDDLLLFTDLAPIDASAHEVRTGLDLISYLGGTIADERMELWLAEKERAQVEALLPKLETDEFLVVMMAGASVAGRRWPAERFGALAAWMISELGAKIVLIGGKTDKEYASIVEGFCKDSNSVVNLTGRTSVLETMAVISHCGLYVGNDTGPMHIAAALGLPVVEISCHPETGSKAHPRSPTRFGPWKVPNRIARPARGADGCAEVCVRGEEGIAHCILDVTTDQVKKLVRELVVECGLGIARD